MFPIAIGAVVVSVVVVMYMSIQARYAVATSERKSFAYPSEYVDCVTPIVWQTQQQLDLSQNRNGEEHG